MEEINAHWVFDKLDIDADVFWRSRDPLRLTDADSIIGLVAAEHARSDFQALYDTTDPDSDVRTTVGAMIGAAMTGRRRDWPLDRSWFHYLFVDLARLDGAMGISLSSDEQLMSATRMYWENIRALVKEAKPAEPSVTAPAEDTPVEEAPIEERRPREQLRLFF